jgi:SMC interacting uncharacterized protein involved in chromosome segregation
MDPAIIKVIEELTKSAPKIVNKIDGAAEEEATPEEIERAKELAHDFFSKYDLLLKRLKPEDVSGLQERLGLEVERVREKLSQLQEAPE